MPVRAQPPTPAQHPMTAREALPPTRGRRALRHAGRSMRFFLFATVPFLILLALALALTFVRLKHGPISLSFLVPPIEKSLNAVLHGYVATVDDAIVRLTDDSRLEFRLQNVRFAEADGDIVASSPLAALEISRHALMEGRLVPSRVELIRPELFLTYAADKGLSLSFSALPEKPPETDGQVPAPGGITPPQPAADTSVEDAGMSGAGLLKKLDFGQLLSKATSQARDMSSATTFLREFGVRDATLTVDTKGHRTVWQLPELNLDVDHREKQSVISGRARVASGNGSWRVAFHTEDSAGQTVLRASVRDLVPSLLFGAEQGSPLLGLLDLSLGADITLAMQPQGGVHSAHLDIGLGEGRLLVRDRMGKLEPIPVAGARIKLNFDPGTGTVVLDPSPLHFGGSSITVAGQARATSFGDEPGWSFDVSSVDGTLGGGAPGATPIALERLSARGRYLTSRDFIELQEGLLTAGGASVKAVGEADMRPGNRGARFSASFNAMSVETLRALWLVGMAPQAREWVTTHVLSGQVKAFDYRREIGSYAPPPGERSLPGGHSALTVELNDASFKPTLHLPVIDAPRVLVVIDDGHIEISVPDGTMKLGTGESVSMKAGRLLSENIYAEPPHADVSFKAQGDAVAALALLGHERIALINTTELPFKAAEGRVEAQLSFAFPMQKNVTRQQIVTSGSAKLKDGRFGKLLGEYDVQGASIAVDFGSGAIEAKGEAIVRGVLARLSWQRILDAPEERQPPLRITATLDNADRRQLGIELGHFLTGEVPVDLQLVPGTAPGERKIHVRADLSGAELSLTPVAWKKPPGRRAFAEFDISPVQHGKYELQNFRVAGDNIAIEGWAGIGADRKVREFQFPDFSINVVTRLKVQGNLRNDDVWDLKVRGTTFEGKDMFRSLFTLGREAGGGEQGGKGVNVDVDAQIDNVIGFSEISMRSAKVQASTRDGRLTALEARGTLDGGAPLAVILDRDGAGQRRIRADSTDAGLAFKMIGFYSNMQSGRVRLEVNLDGKGAAEKAGNLWVEDFRVLGDAVVSEVVSSGFDDGRPSIGGKKRVVREVFEFDAMRVPFSVGHGQFVLDDAYVKGPLLGATIRGKLDYKTERVNLGGTYIPLQGLNNAFGQIPVLGQILSGPRGEGLFGITFAVTGAMANPQVIVNPLSLVAPGIFREVFQMTAPSPKVQPRGSEAVGKRPRKSRSTEPSSGSGSTIDGWSSETKKP